MCQHRLSFDDDQRQRYIKRILSRFCLFPSTCGLVRPADRAFASQLFDRQVPIAAVEAAFALASLRHELRPPSAPPLKPIRSLRYFEPIIDRILDDSTHFPSLWPLAIKISDLRANEPPPDDLPPW
jgi:hypothetical protein